MAARLMSTFPHEKSGLPDTSYQEETPLLGDFLHTDDKPAMLERAKEKIRRLFPKVDFKKLGPIGFSKKGNQSEIVSFGPRGGESKSFKVGDEGLLKSFRDSKKSALGQRAEDIIAEDRDTIKEQRQRLREAETNFNRRKRSLRKETGKRKKRKPLGKKSRKLMLRLMPFRMNKVRILIVKQSCVGSNN